VDPKRAIPRADHEKTAKVFVGGLAPQVTSELLKEFLSQFGQVMDATVMFDRDSGRSKGFAFATFIDEECVTRAMAASGIDFEGKPVEIKKAQPRGSGNLPNKFGPRQNQNNMNMGGMNMGMGMGMGMGNMNMGAMGMGGMGNMGMGGMGMNTGGFDPNAMAMMYQNMMKSNGMGLIVDVIVNIRYDGWWWRWWIRSKCNGNDVSEYDEEFVYT
jgi:RNA-binding protein Musashi